MAQIELQLPISKTHLDFSNHLKLSKGKMVKMASLTLHVLWKHLEYLKVDLTAKQLVECKSLFPVSLSVFSLAPDLLFDCSRVLKYGLFCSLRVDFQCHVILHA